MSLLLNSLVDLYAAELFSLPVNNHCPHFPLCSGCELGKDIFHPPIWNEALSFFAKINLAPPLHTQGFERTRYKAKLAVRPKTETDPEIGLFKKNSHEVLSIPSCLVHRSSINQGVSLLKQAIIDHQILPYRETPPSGLLRYVQLFADRESGQIQLALILNADRCPPHLEPFLQSLQKQSLWHSIWLNFHPTPNNRIFGDSWQLIQGEPFLWQTLNKIPIAFHPAAFSQTHLPLFEKMLQTIDSWVEPEQKIIELYAGVGAISLSLSHKAPEIHLIENNPYARLSFQQSAPPSHLIYHSLDAVSSLDLLSDNSLLVVDPPRKGLEEPVLKKISQLKQSRLIYVSCNFETFRRDSERLLEAGWKMEKAEGYLLLPGTNHVEILSYFLLRQQSAK